VEIEEIIEEEEESSTIKKKKLKAVRPKVQEIQEEDSSIEEILTQKEDKKKAKLVSDLHTHLKITQIQPEEYAEVKRVEEMLKTQAKQVQDQQKSLDVGIVVAQESLEEFKSKEFSAKKGVKGFVKDRAISVGEQVLLETATQGDKLKYKMEKAEREITRQEELSTRLNTVLEKEESFAGKPTTKTFKPNVNVVENESLNVEIRLVRESTDSVEQFDYKTEKAETILNEGQRVGQTEERLVHESESPFEVEKQDERARPGVNESESLMVQENLVLQKEADSDLALKFVQEGATMDFEYEKQVVFFKYFIFFFTTLNDNSD
jgi:hypothetical protein